MAGRLKDLVAQRTIDSFVGRQVELAALMGLLEKPTPIILHLYGIGGIGKTRLMQHFAELARSQGAAVVYLDCYAIEPSESGLLRDLSNEIGCDPLPLEQIADKLAQLAPQVVLIFDTYEVFRLMDSWLRTTFLPELQDNIRVVFSGREPPVPAWLVAPGWQSLFRSLPLDTLADHEARFLLREIGVAEAEVGRVNRLARGHPLSLKLAAAAVIEHPTLNLETIAARHVVGELLRIYLNGIRDPITLQALQAAAVIRRVTRSLLGAMLPDAAAQEAYDRLQELPFVTSMSDGLLVHDSIQQALAASLRTSDPSLYNSLRQAAWRQLRREFLGTSRTELWRYAADMLFLVEQPIVREAFFPSNLQPYAVEPAQAEDGPTLLAIARRHDGPEAAHWIEFWWQHLPEVFYSIRDRNGLIAGYYLMFDPSRVSPALLRQDPITNQWLEHLRRSPLPKGQHALFCRRWLDAELGEVPSPTQAACWLDIKASYVAMRSSLRRIYCPAINAEIYGPVLIQLRFQLLPDCAFKLDGQQYHTAMLDFGPELFNGWLTSLVGLELGVEQPAPLLDANARQVVVNGDRISLTSLEFELLQYLYRNEGKAISRDDLLAQVWNYHYQGGSNLVDARIRTLRRKLGDHAGMIETVAGLGYRFRRADMHSQGRVG